MSTVTEQSRRRFLQFLAGSPLIAAGSLPAFAGEAAVASCPIRSCGRRRTSAR